MTRTQGRSHSAHIAPPPVTELRCARTTSPSPSLTPSPLIPTMQKFQTANPYEKQFGYSRAVRKGPFISVSGTTSIHPVSGKLLHPGSAGEQARAIFEEIIRAVRALGGEKDDIVRVRMFVTDGGDADKAGAALKDALGDVGPTATMIVGAQFVSSEMLVEIEADAVVMVCLCPLVLFQRG